MIEKQQQQQQQQQLLAKEVFSPQITKLEEKELYHYIKMKHGQLI